MTIDVYVRVSDDDQNPQGQREDLQRWLAVNFPGQAARWYEDKVTGKTLNRPAMKRLNKAINRGDVQIVVVWKLDRMARTLFDGITLLASWLDKGVRVISITQQIDLTGIMGQAFAALLFAIAEMELKHIKERQASGIRVAKAKGVYKGRKPGTTKGSPERAQALSAKGLTADEIAAALGVKRRTVQRYLNRVNVAS